MSGLERGRDAVAAARALLAEFKSLPLASDAAVTDLIGCVAELSRVVGAVQVRTAAEVAARSRRPAEESLCRRLGTRSAKEALAGAFGMRARQSADLFALAEATTAAPVLSGGEVPARFPRVADALGTAELSLPQAQAIVQVLEPAAPRADLGELAWAENALVEAATDEAAPLVPELLTAQGKLYAAMLDPDGVLPDAERQRAMRSASIRQDRNGMWVLHVVSPAEEGSSLQGIVDAHEGPRVRVRFQDPGGPESTDDGPLDGDDADGVIEAVDERTREQKRHDIVVGILRAHAASAEAPTAGGEAPTLVLTGTIEAYLAYVQGAQHRDAHLRVEHTGALLPIEWVDRVLCGGSVQLAVTSSHHHTLMLGRTQRLFSRAQRRALALRDKGCAVKGCGLPPAWCEAHHVQPWLAGGPTDVDNGILLCSHHHHEVHAGRLRVERAGPQPGRWRVVAQLQPPRNARAWLADGDLAAASTTALSAAAAPSLAMRLPDRDFYDGIASREGRRDPSGRDARSREGSGSSNGDGSGSGSRRGGGGLAFDPAAPEPARAGVGMRRGGYAATAIEPGLRKQIHPRRDSRRAPPTDFRAPRQLILRT